MRRSLRLSMKNLNYESPLKKSLQQRQKGKRQIDEESSKSRPTKRQKLNNQRRSSVIIINDENDIGSESSTSEAGIEVVPDDSLVIVEEWPALPATFAEKPKQPDDITIVWSSVPNSENKNNYVIPYNINKTSNQKMLKGEYPQKWLGEWLAEKKNEKFPSTLVKSRSTENKRRNREKLKMRQMTKSKEKKQKLIEKAGALEREKIKQNAEKIEREKIMKDKIEREKQENAEKLEREKMREKAEKMEREKMREKAEREKAKETLEIIEIANIMRKTTADKAEIIDITKLSEKSKSAFGQLREIIIDGPNVAFAYTRGKYFSETGLKIVIDYFKDKGHKVTAFIPQHVRSRSREILEELNRIGDVVFTPSRKAGSKVITPYDDRYILEYATKCRGIIISNDQYKDLYAEKPEWRDTIENRILPPTFVGDHLMFPDDPLGRNGPNLDTFLRHAT